MRDGARNDGAVGARGDGLLKPGYFVSELLGIIAGQHEPGPVDVSRFATMPVEPRAALDRLIAALVAHFDSIASRSSDDDTRVDDAYDVLADAFDAYDEALAREYSEVTPFLLVDEDHDDEHLEIHDEEHDDHELDEADLAVLAEVLDGVAEITDDDADDLLHDVVLVDV